MTNDQTITSVYAEHHGNVLACEMASEWEIAIGI